METFVVRVWTPADAGEPVGLHGIVEHVGSGEQRRFRGPEELLTALSAGRDPSSAAKRATGETGEARARGGP
jgi:hypothetical protein